MLFDLIATVSAGFLLAGLALGLKFLLRGRAPAWIVPVAAGLGMLCYAIWSEYSWFERARATLPDGVEVASSNTVQAWYRPWTYLVPQVDRFIAVDHRMSRRNEAHPGQVLTGVLLMGRWEPSRQFGVIYDCSGLRRADLIDGVVFDEAGGLEGARWIRLEPDDAVLRVACR